MGIDFVKVGYLSALILATTSRSSPSRGQTLDVLDQNILSADVDDGYTPHGPPFNWGAIGDSYTAGPGAGEPYTDDIPDSCGKTKGAYAYQLDQNWPYEGEHHLQFVACSGCTTKMLINNTLTDGGSKELRKDLDIVVLTIGGNDVGFSDIVRACLIPIPFQNADCEATLGEKYHYLNLTLKLRHLVWKVYDGIFERLKRDSHYQVYHILYSRLFNPDTKWCNGQSLGVFPFYKPLLTRELRKALNDLVDKLNDVIKGIAKDYVKLKLSKSVAGWSAEENRLFTLDPDLIDDHPKFWKHRFCEPGVEDPSFRDDKIWFFAPWSDDTSEMAGASYFGNIDAKTCRQDPRYESTQESAFTWDCNVARYFASPGAQKNLTVPTGFGSEKWFHPKTVGFGGIKDMLVRAILNRRPQPGFIYASTERDGPKVLPFLVL